MVKFAAAAAAAAAADDDDDDDDSNDDNDSFHYNQIYSRSTMIDSSSCSSNVVDFLVLVVATLL